MFSNSGAPSALYKYIQELETDVGEKKRQLKKEEEVNKSLQEEYRKKNEQIRTFQEKSRELDHAVKQIHDVYLNQKEALERIQESSNLLNKQMEAKEEDLKKQRAENSHARISLGERLKHAKDKFERFMEIYKKFPGVLEYLDLQNRFDELQTTENGLTKRVIIMEKEVTEMQELIKRREIARDGTEYKSLNLWGVALARLHVDRVKEQNKIAKLRQEVTERRARIISLRQAKEEKKKEKAQLEALKRQELSKRSLIDTTPCPSLEKLNKNRVKTRKLLDFPKLSTNFQDFLKIGKKTPVRLGASVPNLASKTLDFSFAKNLKFSTTPGASRALPSLSRAKSLSVLAKGSSGSTVGNSDTSKPSVSITASKSLQKWLNSKRQNEEKSGEVQEVTMEQMDYRERSQIPLPEFEETKDWEEQAGKLETLSCVTENIGTPTRGEDECSRPPPPPKISKPPPRTTPVKSPGMFDFGDMCKSPEDDFKFSTHVFTSKPTLNAPKIEDTDVPSTSREGSTASPFSMFHFGMVSPPEAVGTADFQFAVPSAPPPGRIGKGKSPKTDKNQSNKGEDAEIEGRAPFLEFSSPVTHMDITENDGEANVSSSSEISFGFGEGNTSLASFFSSTEQGGNVDFSNSTDEKEPSSGGFQGFGEEKSSDGFSSFFNFGGPGQS